MNIVTGCSGIDAIAFAATLLDIEVVGQIEIDDFCNKILELRYPGVKRLKNVFDVRGDEFGTVDIFAFGDPCQPHSVAGKQKGTADDRFIWPELFRIIQTMRPSWILNENVVGSVSNGVVREKIVQLESEGYRARAYTLPACAVGAPHERGRIFIVGHSESERSAGERIPIQPGEPRQTGVDADGTGETVGDSISRGCGGQLRRQPDTESTNGHSGIEAMADTEIINAGRLPEREGEMDTRFTVACENVAYSSSTGQQECNTSTISSGQRHNPGCSDAPRGARAAQSGMGGNADGLPNWLRKPGGQEDGSGVFGAFETIFTATLEQILWPAGYGAEQYNYEPPRVASGVKNRVNRLKALGNSIVWQQIFPFLLAIKLIERSRYV